MEKLLKKKEQGPSSFLDFRLLSAFDAESGTIRLAMLESKKPKGEPMTSVADYKATELSLESEQIHHTDKHRFHLADVHMIHKDMNVQHAMIEKLAKDLQTINANYKLERGVTQEKNVRIKTLERILLELSSNPRDVQAAKKLLQDKDNQIAKLKKQLKLPGPHPVDTPELIEMQGERDEAR